MANQQTLTTKLVVDDEASKPTKDYAKILEGLDGETATVALALKAAGVQGDLEDLLADIADLDSSDPTIDVKLEQAAAAKSELDDLETQIKQLNQTPVDVDTKPATKGVKDLGGEADNTRSVMANMVGNSASEMGELAGVAGTAGQAIGQIGEYAADGQLTLGGLAAFAGPMLALSVATKIVSEVMGDIAASKAFHKEQVTKWLDAMREGKDVIEAIRDDMEETSRIEFIASGDVKDATGSMSRLNLEMQDYLDAVSDPKALQAWKDQRDAVAENVDALARQRAELVGAFGPERQAELDAAKLKLKDYNSVIDAAEQKISDTGAATKELAEQQKVYGDQTQENKDHIRDVTEQLQRQSDTLRDQVPLIADVDHQYDLLCGSLDFQQAVLNFQTAFTTAQEKARTETGLTTQDILNLKSEYLRIAQEIGLNPVQVKSDLDKIDQGDIDDVFWTTQQAVNKKPVVIPSTIGAPKPGSGGPGSNTGMYVPGVPGRPTGTQTIIVNLPRGSRASDVTRAMSSHTRRAGRRYGAPVVSRAR